jgi:exodeoxyribonuclease V alpha subunit
VSTAPQTPWVTDRIDRLLATLSTAGVVGPFEIQLAAAALRAEPSASDGSLTALALVARAARLGHVCLALEQVAHQVAASRDAPYTTTELELPPLGPWRDEVRRSALVATADTVGVPPTRPMVWDGGRLYLQRYWAFERTVADEFAQRSAPRPTAVADGPVPPEVDDVLDALFPPDPDDRSTQPDRQRLAAERALSHPVTVIAGGPGTGKTHTIAGILAAAYRVAAVQGVVLRPALAAPTGKAASRMHEAVGQRLAALVDDHRVTSAEAADILSVVPTTIHRLLGARGRSGFRFGRGDPLPYDLVIVDETSMVSLPLLARLLEAMRPSARLVLVGDPFQLTSIEAGTVMADLVGPLDSGSSGVGPLAGRVTELVRGHRFGSGSATAELARAIRQGAADDVLSILEAGEATVHWVRPDDRAARTGLHDLVVSTARQIVSAAVAGEVEAALGAATRVKVLAAVHRGTNGLLEWTDEIESGVRDLVPLGLQGWPRVGTPVMVTGNDPVNRLANGDVGVVVDAGGRWVAMAEADDVRLLAPARLGEWEPWWAMTIHKSQGSEFPHAVVALPTVDSPILTRELLYTAVTRGKPEVTVVASEEIIRLAVSRPVARASGLRDRLWPDA